MSTTEAPDSQELEAELLQRAASGEEIYLGALILEASPQGDLTKDMLDGYRRQFGDDQVNLRRELYDAKTQTLSVKEMHLGMWVTSEVYSA